MTRAREDDVFKAVGPDAIVHPYPGSAYAPHLSSKDKKDNSQLGASGGGAIAASEENEIWFDWAFVDFWKSNFCKFLFFMPSFSLLLPHPFLLFGRRAFSCCLLIVTLLYG
jgi:hypothetical protein